MSNISIEDIRKYKKLERIMKGGANHHRIAILFLLEKSPGLSVDQISQGRGIAFVTTASHLQKLNHSGLVNKSYIGKTVVHNLTPYGKNILTLLRML